MIYFIIKISEQRDISGADIRAPRGAGGGGGVPCYMLYGFSVGLLYAITHFLALL